MRMRSLGRRVRGAAAVTLLALVALGGGCDSSSDTPSDDDAVTADGGDEADATTTADEGVADTGATTDTPSSQDTTTPPPDEGGTDTGTATDTTPPPDEGAADTGATDAGPQTTTCLEHVACATSACTQATEADVATCLTGAEGTCGLSGDSQDEEVAAAFALAECLAAAPCPVDGTNKHWKCLAANCLSEDAACHAGAAGFGTGTCTDTRQCFAGCQPDIFGTPDYACLRACAQVGTQAALETFLDLQYCLNEHCWDSADKVTCEQQAKGSFCQVEESNCSGDVG